MHDGAVAVVSADGALVAHSGDIDQPFFLRSAAKPFQALASQEHGAALGPLELALACASHDGHPVHTALVGSMLVRVGLSETDLQCPPSWPLSPEAETRLRVEMGNSGEPRRIWHDCSGKHAGWLRACQSQGWPIDIYLAPDHPLQVRDHRSDRRPEWFPGFAGRGGRLRSARAPYDHPGHGDSLRPSRITPTAEGGLRDDASLSGAGLRHRQR